MCNSNLSRSLFRFHFLLSLFGVIRTGQLGPLIGIVGEGEATNLPLPPSNSCRGPMQILAHLSGLIIKTGVYYLRIDSIHLET